MLLEQEGAPMFSVDLSTSESGGHVVVALRGELDIAGAAGVAAAWPLRRPRYIGPGQGEPGHEKDGEMQKPDRKSVV